MADMSSAVLWTMVLSGGGMAAGTAIDEVIGTRLPKLTKNAYLAVGAQLFLGTAVLGEAMRLLLPADSASPVGDGLMWFFFLTAQKHLMANVAIIESDFRKLLNGSPRQPTPNPVDTANAAQAATSALAGATGLGIGTADWQTVPFSPSNLPPSFNWTTGPPTL